MKSAVTSFYNALPAGQPWCEAYDVNGTGGVILGYDNKSFPQSTNHTDYYTVTYYDKYGNYIAPAG